MFCVHFIKVVEMFLILVVNKELSGCPLYKGSPVLRSSSKLDFVSSKLDFVSYFSQSMSLPVSYFYFSESLPLRPQCFVIIKDLDPSICGLYPRSCFPAQNQIEISRKKNTIFFILNLICNFLYFP